MWTPDEGEGDPHVISTVSSDTAGGSPVTTGPVVTGMDFECRGPLISDKERHPTIEVLPGLPFSVVFCCPGRPERKTEEHAKTGRFGKTDCGSCHDKR
ncbi:MAG TPA: hypothetical protein VMZ05_06620 [Spirochaetota bacterium]|nr:hypothetical protein [Spirochaetota bacterium]